MVVSVSRRTDIPLFFGDWFVQQLKRGHTKTVNPFNSQQEATIPLNRENVDAFVFWSRNPFPFFHALDAVDDMQIPYYFLITINRYPDFLEPRAPDLNTLIGTLRMLKSRIGRSRIIWRYDPIIVSRETPLAFHKDNILKLIGMISPFSNRLIVSLLHMYPKVKKRFEHIGFIPFDIGTQPDALEDLSAFLSKAAREHGMSIQGCAQDLAGTETRIERGKCVDDVLINFIGEHSIRYRKDSGQRKDCRCHRSVDIGQYGTCGLKCLYCYAR